MADAPVLVTNGAGGSPAVGRLLEGKSFFLVQRLPARSHLIADIESNAGRIVKLETNADYVIADHARKDAPAGSLSYTFVEQAIRKGALPDPLEHPAGPQVGTAREAGSVIPGKSFRTPFSAADDKILWRWVETAKANGEASKGNDVYKRLEAVNPRHTWQSWRDRYVKKLLGKPPAGVMVAANAPPSPPTAPDNDQISNGRSARETTPRPSPKRRKVTASPEKQVAGRSGPVFEQADFDTATSSRPLDTQDILDAQTQYADLNVALPLSDDDDDLDDDSSEDSQIPAKPATKHKVRPGRTVESQALTGDPEQIADKLDEWIATQEVRGYNNEASMRAMLCTSMRPDLAELVLLGEKGGTGLPHDVSGIWSEREDRAVEGGDAAAIRRLEAKHGWDECKARLKFLADWREV
ncbi:uncharacterized protein MYCGRDRAFT_71018 [Zymoseptoria tritici IPO323]|uniref:DNA-binding protein RAP1 n=1 Tax=Zymoseptoria tritici (strain CBS 115943 / IPO323) TaxID=336722 RepID=F9X9I1_ZYMTI|nr:uncharacterized protein MYCGRDRAFT_71018 [Zymoseptoria tritici IPO323]EGP88428.1 hypothetical protein MYCGRDRAFT_71018 [Zymoseptoria tritici IPO323]